MPELSSDQIATIQAELFAGRKIQAIKLYRKATGDGLKEAKDAVEAMEASLRASEPERFSAKKQGCAPILLLAFAAAITIWLL